MKVSLGLGRLWRLKSDDCWQLTGKQSMREEANDSDGSSSSSLG